MNFNPISVALKLEFFHPKRFDMKLVYTTALCIAAASCATTVKPLSNLDYLGNSFPATDSVTVFVESSAIEKPYAVIGKGYIKSGTLGVVPVRYLQTESVAKAKQHGADAVLIQDYVLPVTGLNTVTHTDSLGRETVTVGNTTVRQYGSQRFTILFLKYK